MKVYRQGDIVFEFQGDEAHVAGHSYSRLVVAQGEATGHAHVIEGKVIVQGSFGGLEKGRALLDPRQAWLSERTISLPKTTEVRHPEHGTTTLPAGTYTVRRQREWWGERARYVAD